MAQGFSCRELTPAQVRAAEPIPSGYTSSLLYRLDRAQTGMGPAWSLHETRLERPFTKEYDDGQPDAWIESYAEAAGPDALRFVGAYAGGDLVGLATWIHYSWNRSVWLADIRVRAKARGQGAGSALMDRVKHETGGSRARGIRVETQTSNAPAIRFYRKHGFEISGFDDHLYGNADLARGEVALFLFWERR